MQSQLNLPTQPPSQILHSPKKYNSPSYSPSNNIVYSPSSHAISHRDSRVFDGSKTPQKTQWAILNRQRALQYEQLKAKQKLLARQKKLQFRHQLDNQLQNRNTSRIMQEEEDKKYYNYLIQKEKETQRKERQEKQKKLMTHKNIQELNDKLRSHKDQAQRQAEKRLGTSLNVGYYSEADLGRKKVENKKSLVDALDKQLFLKENQLKIQKMEDLHKSQQNQRYQIQLQNRRKQSRNYHQNQNVYDYYKQLNYQRKLKERDLQNRYIDQAREKHQLEQLRKEEQKKNRLSQMNQQIKSTLDQQMKVNEKRRSQERKINPEDHSYGIIGSIFKDKGSPYDKRQYSDYLQHQAQQQRYNKRKMDYMSPQEYRLNYNQLHKAVNGDYAFDKYIDRSVNIIGSEGKRGGEKQRSFSVGTGSVIPKGESGNDAEIIRMKMQELKEEEEMKRRIQRDNNQL